MIIGLILGFALGRFYTQSRALAKEEQRQLRLLELLEGK